MKRAAKALEMLGIEPTYCSPTAAWTPTGSTSTACRRSPSAPARPRSIPIKEYVNLAEFEKGCRLGVLMATLED